MMVLVPYNYNYSGSETIDMGSETSVVVGPYDHPVLIVVDTGDSPDAVGKLKYFDESANQEEILTVATVSITASMTYTVLSSNTYLLFLPPNKSLQIGVDSSTQIEVIHLG